MAKSVKPIPEGYHTLTNYIVTKNLDRAIEFYKHAFGATELYRMVGPNGKTITHAEIRIGDSPLMLSVEMEDQSEKAAETLHGSPVGFYVYVEDVDQSFYKAVDAGAKKFAPLEDMFWGDRCGTVVDPFGIHWTFATHREDLTQIEIERRAREFYTKKAA